MSDADLIRRGDALDCFMGLDRIGDVMDAIAALTKEQDREKAYAFQCAINLDTALEQLTAARQDAKEAEAYAEELERELNTCRMAQAVMDNTMADVEAKLAKAVETLDKINVGEGWAAQKARATLAEIKGESHE